MTLEVSHIYFAGWSALVVGLSLSTFGMFWSFMIIAYIMLFSVGFFCVLGYLGYIKSVERMRRASNTKLELPEQGLERILKEVWESSRKSYKMDKRLTGSSIIDEPLQEVLQYFFRDYVHSWYCTISNDEEFLYDLRQTLQRALIAFANRSKDVEWVNFLTTRFVDDITNHLKIYRLAKERLDKLTEGDDTVHNIETLFFQVESEMEAGISRQKICLSEKSEKEYLCDISEMLLYLLLPPEDFHNKPFRYLFRELIATTVLLPTVKTMCDPDYINRTLVWLCKDSAFTREAFLTVISDGLFATEDVEATKNKVNVEIVKLRAHDSETSDAADAAVRQQLSSLLFVQKLCDAKIKSIECGEGELPNVPMTSHEELPEPLLVPSQPIPILSLKVILDNNTALSYFIEFITSINGQVYLYFWLTVEGYRVTAEQQLSLRMEKHLQDEHTQKSSSSSPTRTWKVMAELANLRAAARSIFDQYLSDKANPRVQLSKDQLKKTQKRVMQEEPSADCFDEAQLMVYELLGQDQFYGAFLNSQAYMRCLLDLDILKEKSVRYFDFLYSRDMIHLLLLINRIPIEVKEHLFRAFEDPAEDYLQAADTLGVKRTSAREDGDASASNDEDFETRSIAESISDLQEDPGHTDKLWTSDDDLRLTACIDQIGMCKDAGKSYAVYVISVFRATQDGTNSWSVYRRYSDFDDLHMRIKDKFGTITELLLPGKRTFRNMDKDFLEKRRAALDGYIQAILSTTLLERYPGLFEIVANFLEIGKYAREKGQFARKVHNLRHSVHNVSHAIKTVPLGLSGGMQKMFTNKPGGSRDIKDDTDQIYADNDFEDDDNIALRVLLLLMDEIFDLKDSYEPPGHSLANSSSFTRCLEAENHVDGASFTSKATLRLGNLWLRRRIIVFLRQIIKTTYGDRINRKIVESVDDMTSSVQIAEYVKMFRDSFWPGGVLAEPCPERKIEVQLRTRVASKTKMFGSIPEELRRFLGADVTMNGVCRVFDTFQCASFNKRIVYVLAEGMLEQLFPDNKFSDIFRKIHARVA